MFKGLKNLAEYGKYKMLDYESAACDLIRATIELPDTDVKIIPNSEQIVINSEKLGYHFVVRDSRIQFKITNGDHTNFFDYSFNQSVTQKLRIEIYDKLEKVRVKELAEVFQSRAKMFKDLLDNIKKPD